MIIWITLAGVCFLNVAAVALNLRTFLAAYGRLLFPSLVPGHALAAAIVVRALAGRRRALMAVTMALVAYLGLLFGWTVRQRLIPSVWQPEEDVRVITGYQTNSVIGPVWECPLEQELSIPPGDLIALRVALWRDSLFPQLGASLEGSLKLSPQDGQPQEVGVRRSALSDLGPSVAWFELGLERMVRVDGVTKATLALRGSPPVWFLKGSGSNYICSTTEDIRADSDNQPCRLCVAAVYRTPAGRSW